MPGRQQLSITLPDEMASDVRARVAAGEYSNESEVIREALRTLSSRDRAREAWLCTKVSASYDALRANPETGVPLEEVRKRFAERSKEQQS